MTWLDEELKTPNQPEDSSVRLVGKYTHPTDNSAPNTIELNLVVDGFPTLLYAHNPGGIAHEEPAAEDVLARYAAKVNKARRKILATDFQDLGSIRKVV